MDFPPLPPPEFRVTFASSGDIRLVVDLGVDQISQSIAAVFTSHEEVTSITLQSADTTTVYMRIDPDVS